MSARVLFTRPWITDNPSIELGAQHITERLLGKRRTFFGAHSPGCRQAKDFSFGVCPRRELVPYSLQKPENRLIRLVRLCLFVAGLIDGRIAERGLPGEDAFLDFSAHPLNRASGAEIVIKLGKSGENRFEKFAFRILINRFGDGHNPDILLQEARLDIEVVSHIPREPIDLPDEKCSHTVLLVTAELHEFQELRAISKLGRFSLFDEYLTYVDTATSGIFPTGKFLRLQTRTRHLFLGRNAAVDDSIHFRQ
jgi:hypothetical protein